MKQYKTIDVARRIGIHVNTVRLYEKCALTARHHLWESARFRGSRLFLFRAVLWRNFHDCDLRRWRYGTPVGDFRLPAEENTETL